MKIWITKYALTTGIFSVEAEDKLTEYGAAAFKRSPEHYTEFVSKNDFYYSLEHAKEHAEKMRIKKIKSLENQIKKISEIKF